MIQLQRARLAVVCAVAFALIVLIVELPLGELFQQRSELTKTTNELSIVNARNRSLSSAIASLKTNSTIAAIAHSDYGLVRGGQTAYVVLPGASDGPGSAESLSQKPVAARDLVAGDVAALGARAPTRSRAAQSQSGNIFQRVVSRLEFWR